MMSTRFIIIAIGIIATGVVLSGQLPAAQDGRIGGDPSRASA